MLNSIGWISFSSSYLKHNHLNLEMKIQSTCLPRSRKSLKRSINSPVFSLVPHLNNSDVRPTLSPELSCETELKLLAWKSAWYCILVWFSFPCLFLCSQTNFSLEQFQINCFYKKKKERKSLCLSSFNTTA